MVEERYYLGKITSVEDRLLYRIRVSIDNVVDDAMAFPLRGEVDEPRVGDLVLLYNIDPIFQSCYLYSKIKEDNFLGFRSNGKLISITPESITMTVYENDDESSIKARMTMNDDGSIIIESESDIKIEAKSTVNINAQSDINITSDSSLNINATASTTIKSPDVTIKGPGTMTVKGTVMPSASGGPFIAVATAPPPGTPMISGDTIILQ